MQLALPSKSAALLLCLLTCMSGTSQAVQSRLSRARQPQAGRLLYLHILDNGTLDVFGLELGIKAADRGEILWASDWEPLPLHLCERHALPSSCLPLTVGASDINATAEMSGERLSVADLGPVVRLLLDDFKVDVVFHTATMGLFGPMYVNKVLRNGPAATMEFDGTVGEHRLFSSVLTLMMSLGQTMLVMTHEGDMREHLEFPRTLESGILQRRPQAHPPLMYCWTKDKYPMACNELSGYADECIIRSQQYWGGSPAEIHATPDNARSAESGGQSLPVMISNCHASDMRRRPSFALYYDNAEWSTENKTNLTRAALVHQATGLPVKVLAKRRGCVEPAGEAIQCLGEVRGVAAFHQVLHEARLIVAPLAATDNPTLLEAAACGTPVLVQQGHHLMLERHAESPHVAVWSDWDDLERGLRVAMSATEAGRQKLEPWRPPPLRFSAMLEGLRAMLKASEAKCREASSSAPQS